MYIRSQSNCEKWHNLANIYTQPLRNYKSQTNTKQSLLLLYFTVGQVALLYDGSFQFTSHCYPYCGYGKGAAPIYCSDVQSPASGSHDTDLSQVISLQYCIIDNCTIMKIDTGEQLNIVYTTESLLIVTPTDGLTSMAIEFMMNYLFLNITTEMMTVK